ncbi:hypothetical protein LCGC14_3049600 [marine sediment metagenome]|uniref:Uncharacterized protein n=1 Tax=marine sediment metagenome TaxID=412755 RepID=A0A0F8XAE0_9ZZZZ
MDEIRAIIREALEEYAPGSDAIMKDQVAEEILERLQPYFKGPPIKIINEGPQVDETYMPDLTDQVGK